MRGRSTSQRNTIVSSVASVATSSATVVPTSTTVSGSGASGGFNTAATESISVVSDVAMDAGRTVLAHARTSAKNGGRSARIRWAWPTAAGTTTNARPTTVTMNVRYTTRIVP